jgi:hypothetical protein
MGQTRDETTQHVAERLCWQVARGDDSRVARRPYRQEEVDGVYRLDEGAVRDDFFHFLQGIGVMSLLEEAHGAAIQCEMVPFVPDCLALWAEDLVWDGESQCLAQLAVQR